MTSPLEAIAYKNDLSAVARHLGDTHGSPASGSSATLPLYDYGRVARKPSRIAGINSRSFRIFFLTLTLRYPRQSEELKKLARSESEGKLWPSVHRREKNTTMLARVRTRR